MKMELTKKSTEKTKFPSELRLDLVSKDWVIIATGRARRPETFKRERKVIQRSSPKDCPFCKFENLTDPILIFSHGKKIKKKDLKNWTTIVIPNKFPAFLPYPKLDKKIEGNLYQTMNAVGYHEVVITKDHQKSLAQLPITQIKEVIDAYHGRYLDLMKKRFVNHISIFHNHGQEAGASLFHPHSQIITTPLIDVDLRRALSNSERYFKAHRKCLSCQMEKWERKVRKRIVFENEVFLVLCPFASKSAFEVIIAPKKHLPYFEKITEKEKWQLAQAFKIALSKIFKGLNDPAYNFYLHTAPCDGKKYDYYHWHWTILPKTSVWAGFEIGTRMEISTIEPEKAAEYLRKQ
jgi:UDPglucose--hexose-1-phosphate uridylyltransferase